MNKLVTGFLAIIAAAQLLAIQSAYAIPTGLTAGGNVSGLDSGKSVVLNLRINNTTTSSKTVSANGAYTFSASLATGNTYAVSVGIQPSGQICSVANPSGTVSSSNITNINVSCATGYTVGGTLSGLAAGTSVVVRMNTGSKVLTANGPFNFSSLVLPGTAYSVSIGIQPPNQRCTVTNGTGTMPSYNITNVTISCSPTYTVGGVTPTAGISGLNATNCVTLQLNGVGSKLACTNGSFSFSSGLISGEAYSVTVIGQPTGQQCTPSNNTGTISGANVTNVKIDCVNKYTITGTNSPGASISISGSSQSNPATSGTPFTFNVLHGEPISLSASKTGYDCSINGFTNPTTVTANISSLSVTCNLKTYQIAVSNPQAASVSITGSSATNSTNPNNATSFNFSAKHNDSVSLSATKSGHVCSVATTPASLNSIAGNATATVSCNAAYTISGNVSGLGSGKTLKLIRTDAGSLTNTQAGASVDTSNSSFAVMDNPSSEFTAGWGFSVNSSRLLTHLGVWTQGSLYGDVSVGIWDQGGNLLSSVSLLNANIEAYDLENEFSYAELPNSIMLSAGQQYTLGAFYTGGVLAGFGAPVTPINGLSFASPSLVDFGTSLTMPSLDFSSYYSNGLFGPNLRFLTAGTQAAGEVITINADGQFSFPTALVDGSTYAVAVSERPTGQTCSITNASGTIAGANVNNISVTCSNISYTISVANNSGASVSISGSNATNATNPNTASSFNFLAEKDDPVVLSATKTGYSCSITTTPSSINPLTGNAIANVNCSANPYTVGGTNVDGASVAINGSSVTGQSATTATPYSFNVKFGDIVTLTATKTGYTCSVAGSPITVGTADVTDADVTCIKNTYSVGGANADGASIAISGSSITGQSATTANPYSFNAKYGDVVTLTATKTGYTCSVTGSPITVGAANVTNATASCNINTYTVSGTVTGNTGSVTLTNNGSDSKVVSSGGGGFTFTAQNYNTTYLVATSQPSGQVCVVSNGSGTVTANVTNVLVTCNNTYTIGGSITGLSASGLVLSLSGTQGTGVVAPSSDTANPTSGATSYTFTQTLVAGNTYSVSITTQPTGLNCALANQTGTIASSNVSNVNVTCSSISSSSSSSAAGPALNANIILGAPTTTTISMKLYTPDQSGSVSVSYGTSSGNYATTTSPANLVADTPLQLNISGLTQDTQYFYRINFSSSTGGSSQTPEYKFRTARSLGSAFTFTIAADPHLDDKSDINVYNLTLANIADQNADFHVDLGDTFMTEKWYQQFVVSGTGYLQDPATTRAQVQARYKFEMGNFNQIAKNTPLFLVNGNHDAELGWLPSGQASAADLKYWAIEGRSMYFNNPTPNAFYTGEAPSTVLTSVNKTSAYYSWKWGDALFIALDPFWNSTNTTGSDIWNLTLGLTQYQWLQNTLAANSAMKYKFIFLHNLVGGVPDISATSTTGIPDIIPATGKPSPGGSMRGGIQAAQYAEWGGANYDLTTTGGFGAGGSFKRNTNSGWTMPIHDLLVQYGVTAVYHGHDHLYADETLDGIKYQEVPQPSTKYQSNADTNNMPTLAAQGGYPACLSSPATAVCKGSSGFIRVTVDPTAGVTSEYVRTYALPSQGTNKSISASWNVPAPNAASYTIGGHTSNGGGLSGLGAGKSVTLLNSGSDALVLNANGNFTFATPKANGASYNVTVSVQPAGQNCTVSNGSGTVSGANVVNVAVTCVDVVTYTIGGNVSGNSDAVTVALSVSGVQVDTKTVNSGGGGFTFAAQNAGSNWSVSVTSSPSTQTCTLSNNTGSSLGANVTNVSVSCADTLYSISAQTSGLGTGRSIGLSLNGGTASTLTSNVTVQLGSLASGASYTITPVDQTSTQATGGGKRCIVKNHKGTVSAANVTASVVCANAVSSTYVVGGTVSGLTGTLGLSLNTATPQTISLPAGTTGFAFTTPAVAGTYTLSVSTQPTGQVCTTTTNSVTISSANNLTTLAVSCVSAYNVGGTVTGLGTGLSVILLNNGANPLTVSSNAAYSFSMVSGSTYNVTVGTQPANQLCMVMNASGTVASANVTNISVVCYDYVTISAVVTGLPNPVTSGSVVLTLNGDATVGNQLTFTANNATQSFPVKVPPGNNYAVTVVSNTIVTARVCTVTNGVGTTSTGTPTTVTVNVVCKTPPNGAKYFLSGTISGLTGSGLAITLNPIASPNSGITVAENISLAAGSTGFAFASAVNGTNNAAGVSYTGLITVSTQPTGQLCSVANGGNVTVYNANITNIAITCSTAYSIGGTVSGLGTGLSLVLSNGTDNLTVNGNGSFTLPTPVLSGSSYNVSVSTQPTNQTCLLSNNSGTVSGNVTNIVVSCTYTSFTIGGTISGLGANPVILLNNGGDALTVSANGTFTFATALASGSYAVTVGTQPTGMYCQVTQGTGTVGSTNIDNVIVTCINTTACSSPTNAVPPSSDPLWAIYSSPTDPDVDSTPEITTELPNPFATCLAGSSP